MDGNKKFLHCLMFLFERNFLGYMRVLPFEADSGTYTVSALYVLLFLAGMSVGFDLHAFRIIQN